MSDATRAIICSLMKYIAEMARPIVKATRLSKKAVKKQNSHFSAVTLLGIRNLKFQAMLGQLWHYPAAITVIAALPLKVCIQHRCITVAAPCSSLQIAIAMILEVNESIMCTLQALVSFTRSIMAH